jgi:hypothetical protein
MILQAYIDDSRTNARRAPRIFMLGGLVSTVDRWADFSNTWRAGLHKEPRLEYFKLFEALSLTKQFCPSNGWTGSLRDERLCAFADIAKQHALYGISCSMNQGDYDDFVKAFSRHKELEDPYFLCFYQIVDAITSARDLFPPADELDYIFDVQGDVGLRAVHWWDRLKAVAPWREVSHLGSTPVHRDDKVFLPLQAADLYAGLRRIQTERGDQMWSTPRQALQVFEGLQFWHRRYTKDDLMELGAGLVIKAATRRQRR